MYYSKAYNWGDDLWRYDVCYTGYTGILRAVECEKGKSFMRWDWLEQGPPISAEASVTASPAGDRFYAVWNSELEIALDTFTDMDRYSAASFTVQEICLK